MPNALYTQAAQLALSAMRASGMGRDGTLTHTTRTLNTVTGAVSAPTTTTAAIHFITPSMALGASVAAFDNWIEPGDSLRKRELRLLKIAAYGLALVPESGDTVVFDGVTWEVIGCTPINPAGVPIVYHVGAFRT